MVPSASASSPSRSFGSASKLDSCRFGTIQVSKGVRGAYGAKTTNSSFSWMSRVRSRRSCPTMSQKMQRSLSS